MGYPCTVFEALPVAGGMLAVGIPEYRLPDDILKYEIDYIEKTGVEIKTGKKLGKDFTIDDLINDGYDAVFLAVGSHKAFELEIEGADHPAVIPGVKFLSEINLKNEFEIGERVAVIGGGNVAIDSARSALRIGSKEVFIVYRRSLEQMPALPEELEQLEEEGIEIKFLAAPKRILADGNKLKGLECMRMELGEPDSSGRRRPVPIEGSEFVLDCDNVIVAIGQTSELNFISNEGLKASSRGILEVDPETDLSNRQGVFAGGDMVTGPLNVVTAIFHGKLAAKGIHQYLSGKKVEREYSPIQPAEHVDVTELTDEEMEKLARPKGSRKPGRERIKSLVEVEECISEQQAVLEAKRCLRCDMEIQIEMK